MSDLLRLTGSLVACLGESLQEINVASTDIGVANLIIKYAQEIDNGNMATLAKLGPLLLAAMESLQMSPRSRAMASKGGVSNVPTSSGLDELRAKRRERQNGTSDIHTATS
jgi:hypothetical protein